MAGESLIGAGNSLFATFAQIVHALQLHAHEVPGSTAEALGLRPATGSATSAPRGSIRSLRVVVDGAQ